MKLLNMIGAIPNVLAMASSVLEAGQPQEKLWDATVSVPLNVAITKEEAERLSHCSAAEREQIIARGLRRKQCQEK